MKKVLMIAVACMCCGTLTAADKSEEGVPTTPLKIYSAGIGVGALRAANSELKDVSRNILKLSYTSSYTIVENMAMFLDIDYLLPKNHFGGDIGFDFVFASNSFRPFAGAGVGGHYINRENDFGDDFGPSLTAHFGFALDLNENVAVRFRAPYHIILNESSDQMAGIDIAFLFSSKYKNVRKLNYN